MPRATNFPPRRTSRTQGEEAVSNGGEAKQYGLVSHVTEHPFEDAMKLVEEISQRSPDSVAAAKKLFAQAFSALDAGIEDLTATCAVLKEVSSGHFLKLHVIRPGGDPRWFAP